jgi:hypothetical protein
MPTSDRNLTISEHQRKSTPKTSNLLTCTSRFLAFRFTDCQKDFLRRHEPATSSYPFIWRWVFSLLLGTVYDFFRRLYRIELATASPAPLVSLFARSEQLSKKNAISAHSPLHCSHDVRGSACFHRTLSGLPTQQYHQSLPRLPSRNTFPTDLSCTKICFYFRLLNQFTAASVLRSKAKRCCAPHIVSFVASLTGLRGRQRHKIAHEYFPDPWP